jgi:hypothetical protein
LRDLAPIAAFDASFDTGVWTRRAEAVPSGHALRCGLMVVATVAVMPRPLRDQRPGAIYHVTTRGVNRAPIYLEPGDRHVFLHLLASVSLRRR